MSAPDEQRREPCDEERGAPPRRFFLALPLDRDAPRLDPLEEHHALRVVRVARGERCLGLDGAGGLHPLRVVAASRRGLELALDGPSQREPEPGEPGAPLPWLEVAVAWPRAGRAEAMLDRLTQLGVAAVRPLACRHGGPAGARTSGRDADGERPLRIGRLERVLREACKQSRRAWLPELAAPNAPGALAAELGRGGASALALLEPGAGMPLDTWTRSLAGTPLCRSTRARPIVLVVGPEGGFDADERTAWLDAGATPTRLGPHVLRIETAAEAALAVVATILG